MAVALEQFVKQLEDSGVISSGKLESFIPPKASPKDAQELARQLVLSQQLTKYQVQEIYKGRAKSLILGNYTILDKIGAGGMGQVFKAEHRRMHRVVAIKMLPNSVVKDSAAIARFQREVEAAAKLSHRNIVAAYDANEADGIHFLAMEYVEGSDLSALIKKDGPLSVGKAVDYTLQAARGLEFAHAEHVVHRDIKPANLLLDNKGTVKILDMGLARIESGIDAETQAELTGTGAVLGTVDYMAPEQSLSTKSADARADIYSLGCTLYYLLIGKPIYTGESVTAKLLAHHHQPVPDLCKLKDDVPEQLQMIFSMMVAKKVDDRFQTMSEVVAALESPEESTFGRQTSIGVQQSIDTTPDLDADAGALTFLNDVPLRTTLEPKPKQKPPDSPSAAGDGGGENEKLIPGKTILRAVAAAVLGAVILAGVLIALRTTAGPPATVEPAVNKPAAAHPALEPAVNKPAAVDAAQRTTPSSRTAVNKTWIREVAVLPAEEQVKAVAKKLKELNPGFDGQETHKIENGVVTELHVRSDQVTDIMPVRALVGLKVLECGGAALSDLSPLKGMPLTELSCWNTKVSDLSSLAGMPLLKLGFGGAPVSDLSPLKGMRLTGLWCPNTHVSDLSPLQGMKLTTLDIHGTHVSDLSLLRGMPLTDLNCRDTQVADLVPLTGAPLTILDCTNTQVLDLSPLKGMHLTVLLCDSSRIHDLSPLGGMPLATLGCGNTMVSNLSPLKGMPLTILGCWNTQVSDLSPLEGMPLTEVYCGGSAKVSDLSPLKGTKLTHLDCNNTQVCDLSPLNGMNLTELFFTPKNITKGMDIIRTMKGLERIRIPDRDPFSPDEFWEKYDTGEFLPWDQNPAFKKWMKNVAALPAEQQAEAVAKKLQALNPGFDGRQSHKIENGVVTELQFMTESVADISPVRALIGLKDLSCHGGSPGGGQLSDLSPLQGMRLAELNCGWTRVADLSPLIGMRLVKMNCDSDPVKDLSPLQGMPLTELVCCHTRVSDLSPIQGMKLENLYCEDTKIGDLSPLKGMKLSLLWCNETRISDTSPLQDCDTLKTLKLYASRVAPEGVAALQKALPKCQIEWPLEGIVFGDPAAIQMETFIKKLQELNPAFHGTITPKVENGTVTELRLSSENVTDISPVHALTGLKVLDCSCSYPKPGKLLDLSPLQGLPLTSLNCSNTQVSDLSPLKGMSLAVLDFWRTHVSDLSPLRGMPLQHLDLSHTPVLDLSPLKGMPLNWLHCHDTQVSDLSPLEGMELTEVRFTPKNISKGLGVIRRMKSLTTIQSGGGEYEAAPPSTPAEFWKKYDAGELSR